MKKARVKATRIQPPLIVDGAPITEPELNLTVGNIPDDFTLDEASKHIEDSLFTDQHGKLHYLISEIEFEKETE